MIPPACRQPQARVTGGQQPTVAPLESEGSSCSAPPSAGYSRSVDTRLAAIIACHLRGKVVSKGPEVVEPGCRGA